MNILKYILALYLIVINITAFAMMGIDKKRAKKHEWRIPEARLFGAALLGGRPRSGAWHVFFQAQDKTLVFCCRNAIDNDS